MSKKNNTLNDLDEFLKQQAATLTPPAKLSDTLPEKQTEKKETTITQDTTRHDTDLSENKILNDLIALSKKEGHTFTTTLCDLIIKSLDAQQQTSAEEKMLINTALYLKSGDNWKDVIREYWRKRS